MPCLPTDGVVRSPFFMACRLCGLVWTLALKTTRLREELVGAAGARAQVIEIQEKADALAEQAEGQARAKEKAEAEVIKTSTAFWCAVFSCRCSCSQGALEFKPW